MFPNSDIVYVNRAFIYTKKGEFDQAISDYNKAIEINSTNAKIYGQRAITYFFKKDYEKSWQDVRKAEELGYKFDIGFLKELKQASGIERWCIIK